MSMAIPINEDPYSSCGRKTSLGSIFGDPSELVVPRPASLAYLIQHTDFTQKELKHLYRAFKGFCTNGILTRTHFKEFYAKLFPKTKSENYADFVFRGFDINQDNYVCFEDLAETYSIITRGSAELKLNWLFDFFDIDNKGRVGRLEILEIIKSFYALTRYKTEAEVQPELIFDHAIKVYEEMATPGSHYLTRDEFVAYGLRNKQMLEYFETFSVSFLEQPREVE